jgi:hypothetical protein
MAGVEELTPKQVESISAMADEAARNLRITEGYFYLGDALARWIGAGGNWCAFAGWASRQAGRTIRGEDLARHLSRRLAERPELQALLRELSAALKLDRTQLLDAIADAVMRMPAARRSSSAVARGNVKVFQEIGHVIARMIEAMRGRDFGETEVEAFCESLPPGPPPDGQALLREAFGFYARARAAATPKQRAEWLLFGNLKIGFHEQTRLQPEVLASMEAGLLPQPELEQAIWDALWAIRPIGVDFAGLRRSARRRLAGRLASGARESVRQVITERLMVIELPAGAVRLGEDHRQPYPATLLSLENEQLAKFWKVIDPGPGNPSGADDWGDFADRMHFIGELFRRYQEHPGLTIAPSAGFR